MSKQPNILLVITDHQAYFGHHRAGEFEYVWPRFEKFASEGVRFEQAYTVCPISSPARGSMMTGRYPSKHGMIWNNMVKGPGSIWDFRSTQKIYSHHLAEAGYRNAYVGKWHCGHKKLPKDYGIEGWSLPDYGKIYMSDAYKEYAEQRGLGDARVRMDHSLDHPEWAGQTMTLHHDSPWRFMDGSGVLEGPPEAHEEQFVAHLASENSRIGERRTTLEFDRQLWGPHHAYYPSEPFASMFDPKSIPEYPSFRDDLEGRPLRHHLHKERDFKHVDKVKWAEWPVWQEVLARAYGQGLQTDAAIGDILDALDKTGEADNTIVIWCADHGDALASHGGLWDKASGFSEEVGRVPMAIRWPAGIDAGRCLDDLVCNMDVTATMLDAAGVTKPDEMDSRSLLPLCSQESDADWPDELICEHNGHGEDILQRIIMRDGFKFVAALYDGDELYDLKNDPYEMKNLTDDPAYQDVKSKMRDRIINHIEQTNDRRASRLAFALNNGF